MSALPVTDLPGDQRFSEAHASTVAGPPLDRGHASDDAHSDLAAVDHPRDGHPLGDVHHPPAVAATLAGHRHDGAQHENVGQGGEHLPPADPTTGAMPMDPPGRPEDVVLAITADLLDDLERVRIATENRVRSLAQVKGLDGTPVEARMAGVVDGIAALEHEAELQLQRAMRSHPLGPWVKAAKGLGEKQAGRLLAAIGDPYVHSVTGEPRTVSQLWAYCGYHVLRPGHWGSGSHAADAGADSSQGGVASQGLSDDHHSSAGVAPSRARGQRANWNADAKKRAWLVAKSCIKVVRKPCAKLDGQAWAEHTDDCECSPYRVVYDAGRRKYVDAVHQAPCRRCGPAGRPAAIGTPLSEGHKDARALRLVAKAVLRDLWIAARDMHAAGL